jgi:hypothetical protein
MYALLRLAQKHLLGAFGPGDDAVVKAFARSGGAVAATLEVLLHGCPGFGALARYQAADTLRVVCGDVTALRHMRGAFARVAPALVRRLERGAPDSTRPERGCLVQALQVRWGRTGQAQGKEDEAWGCMLRLAA